MMVKEKYHNVEFLRFIFAIIIVYFHILHNNIMRFIGSNQDYVTLAQLSNKAGYIVECFFIISGYFLYKNLNNLNSIETPNFIWKKFVRLWPVLVFSLIIEVLFFRLNIYTAIFNSVFLQCIGLSLDYKGINWYISPLFWTLIFYYAVFKNFDNKKAYVVLGGICYFSYLTNISFCNGGFGRETVWGIVNLGLTNALANIGLGIFIGKTLDVTEKVKISFNSKFMSLTISLLEICCILFLVRYFLLGLEYKNAFIVVIVFSILFVCFIKKRGLISNLLNMKIFSELGKYVYSIYVMQQISFNILQRTLWKTTIVNDTVICILISLIFSVFLGLFTYHTIEKPSYKYLIYGNVIK